MSVGLVYRSVWIMHYDHGVHEGYPISGQLCCKLHGRVKHIYLLKSVATYFNQPDHSLKDL